MRIINGIIHIQDLKTGEWIGIIAPHLGVVTDILFESVFIKDNDAPSAREYQFLIGDAQMAGFKIPTVKNFADYVFEIEEGEK